MNVRRLGCLASGLLSIVAGAVVAGLVPVIMTERGQAGVTWLVRAFVFVLVAFTILVVLSKILAMLFPTPAEIAARAADRAMRAAPVRGAREAIAGAYLRVRGKLETFGEPLEAPVTGRACLFYIVTRHAQGPAGRRHGSTTQERHRGARARVVDASGSILVALEGRAWMPTGDAMADAMTERARALMVAAGEDPRLAPDVTFVRAPTRVGSDGAARGEWPLGARPVTAEMLGALAARDFPRSLRGGASFDERLLLPGDEVEVVGLVEETVDGLVLDGPVNARLRVCAM